MNNKITVTFAVLALLLGVAHLAFGLITIKSFSLQLMWFLGAGIAMIVTALANLAYGNVLILRIQNTFMLAFIAALSMLAPQPQVLLGLILFAGLLISSCFK